MKLRSLGGLAALVLMVCLAHARVASAQANLLNGPYGPLGYGTSCLSPNDDGSSDAIDLTPAFPQGLNFFGHVYTQVYVNTNGNISFGSPLSQFTPNAFPGASQPIIAPYWADVDIRTPTSTCGNIDGSDCGGVGSGPSPGNLGCQNPTTDGVWWFVDPGPPGRFIVTWDHVGYYYCSTDKVMNFQLILTAASSCSSSDMTNFDIEFRYNICGWETGSASGGSCGTGGTQAVAGYDANDSAGGHPDDFYMIMGSRAAGISNILCTMSNVGMPGIWDFQVRGGQVMCPTAGQPCMTGMPGICAQGTTQCVVNSMGSSTSCQPLTGPQPTQCNGLDNNCDGTVDTGPCPAGTVCLGAECVPQCVEGACFQGQTCNSMGYCVDNACMNVTCPAGQRCVGGSCVDACSGVTCPIGQVCRLGTCVDPCASLNCGSGQVCEMGACVPPCPCRQCSSGQSCTSDGHCVDSSCASVSCSAGQVCQNGNCVDPCTGAVCPNSETCSNGQCQVGSGGNDGGTTPTDGGSMYDGGTYDAGSGSHTDGGTNRDGSTTGDAHTDARADGHTGTGATNAGCACRTDMPARSDSRTTALALAALGSVFLARRKRRGERR